MTEFDARAHIEQLIHDPAQPVVVFALEWCEFCWTVRKLFEHCAVAYRAVLLDSSQYQQYNRGRAMRDALANLTGSVTIPQLFIAGEFIGGCTDLISMARDGSLGERLAAAGVSWKGASEQDPSCFLPAWLQPRFQ